MSITANVEGEDLGRAARRIEQAIAAAGEPPRGVRILTRGQVAPMNEMFTSLAVGLGLAVVVILVLLTAYFESPRLALASVSSVPGVLCGVVIMLLVTGTTLNIESFMGAIMCIGVSVSNSVMLVTFIAMEWQGGKAVPEAARAGAQDRLRPILMTACAMTVGMVPMALALEHGSEMQAPLGPGGDRRAGRVHLRHALDRAVDFRPADGPAESPVPVAVPRRPGQRALRPRRRLGRRVSNEERGTRNEKLISCLGKTAMCKKDSQTSVLNVRLAVSRSLRETAERASVTLDSVDGRRSLFVFPIPAS